MVELKLKVLADLDKLKKDIAKTLKEKFQVGVSGKGGSSKADKQLADNTKAVNAGFISAVAILKGIQGFSKKLVAASPELQKSLGVLNKSFNILLRPIGDLLSSFLRPLSLAMLKFAIPFYKKAKSNLDKPGGKTGGAIGAVGGAVAGGIAGAKLGGAAGALLGPGGAAAGAAIGGTAGAIGGGVAGGLAGINIGPKVAAALEKVKDFGIGVKDAIENFVDPVLVPFRTKMNAAGQAMRDFESSAKEKVAAFFSGLPDKISVWLQDWTAVFEIWFGDGTGSIRNGLEGWKIVIADWWDTGKELLGGYLSGWGKVIGTWFKKKRDKIQVFFKDWGKVMKKWFTESKEKISGWLGGWAGKLKTFFVTTVPGLIGQMVSAVKSKISAALKSLKGKAKGIINLAKETAKGIIEKAKEKKTENKDSKNGTDENDFILTKGNRVIRPNANDTIVGFKGAPPNLGGGSSGGSTVINVSLSMMDASGISNTTLENIARAIEDRLKTSLSSRTIQQVGI